MSKGSTVTAATKVFITDEFILIRDGGNFRATLLQMLTEKSLIAPNFLGTVTVVESSAGAGDGGIHINGVDIMDEMATHAKKDNPTFTTAISTPLLRIGAAGAETDITASPAEINKLDGANVSTEEINTLVGIGTTPIADQLTAKAPLANPAFTTDLQVKGITAGGGARTIVTNTAFGKDCLKAVTLDTAIENTAFGYLALASMTSGTYNTAVGSGALKNCTTGFYNTCVGSQAGAALTAVGSSNNTAIGHNALQQATNSAGNTAIGAGALEFVAGAVQGMTAVGTGAGAYGSAGSCVAVGYQAMYQNTNGGNTHIGYQAGYANNNNSGYSTFIGYQAGDAASGPQCNNSTALGANAKVTKSNQVVLGDANIVETLIGGSIVKRALDTAPSSWGMGGADNEVRICTDGIYLHITGYGWKRILWTVGPF